MILQWAILAFVIAQRLSELVIAQRNTARLIADGGYEVGRGHYPVMVLMHVSWLASLIWLAPSQPVNWFFLGCYAVLQVFRLWILTTMGQRWTTRIIVVPGEQLVAAGPYRYLRHPNYVLVTAEIACLPMVFGLWPLALVFSVLNAAMLYVRISAENAALAGGR
ncbi:MAG: hypothetical protein HKN11_08210 [Rhizobiales bacterium]|nr:hypothetical protein [Hyphomicrobiales bacterium]